ncbi:MAG: DUF349 domain-containing protein [Acidobacteria bacterium]|nr:DUF349 domain-containing protein [Acidobacteriota bacterium]
MSFLDRFKPQPKWKHADPATRAAAVAEMPDGPELEELALADEDVRVRRAAVDRLDDVEILVRMAHAEVDPELRREVTDRLVGIATAPADTDAAAARALEGVQDEKHCATIARSSPHETVRTASLARVHEVRLLGSVARSAADSQTALEAVHRIADGAELLNVALKTEHKEAGVAALERAVDATAAEAGTSGASGQAVKDAVENVAARARSKAVAKRARAMLQAIEEAAMARQQALDAWQQRVASVLARVEALAAAAPADHAREQLAQAEDDWRETAADGSFELDADATARFSALVDNARTAIQAHEREQAERRAREEWLAGRRAARTAVCERIEALRGDDTPAQIEQARAEWLGLVDGADGEQDDEAAAFIQRFEEACRRAAARHENRQETARINARLVELSSEAERVTTGDEISEDAWSPIAREWQDLHPKAEGLDPAASQRFAEAEARIQSRADERRAAAERTLRQHVQRTEQLIERAVARATAEDLTLREADRIARELRAAVDAPPELHDREQRALIERLQTALTTIGPRLHELREMDEWKRFANAAVQEELIARTEALAAKYGFDAPDGPTPENLEKAATEVHDIQERWKASAEAPRAQAQALWHRYRLAADPIQAKLREFFAHRSAERQANLDRKMAIIDRAESLSESTDWIKTAEELKKLQVEWQSVGPVPRQDTRVTWKRFRDACDKFFTRRNADLAERKQTWAVNMAAKEALIARAEALSTSMEWESAAAEIRRLQVEWKATGPVRRNKSEVVWQRFRAACDMFFERYKRRDQIQLEAKQADREALVVEMESLGAPAPDPGEGATAPEVAADITSPPPQPVEGAALLEHVRSLRSRWNQTLPAVRHGADPLSARFMDGLERLIASHPAAFEGTELDVQANQRKMEKLCDRVEGFLRDAAAPASSSQALADMLREALASNTIGGRAGEESRWRAMAEDVRQAQASWSRLGPVPGESGRQLGERFHRACSRFFDQYRRRVPQQQESGARRGKPVAVR